MKEKLIKIEPIKVGTILRELLSLTMYLLKNGLHIMCTNLPLSQHMDLVYLIWKNSIAMGMLLIVCVYWSDKIKIQRQRNGGSRRA